jgi:hypothetical protein
MSTLKSSDLESIQVFAMNRRVKEIIGLLRLTSEDNPGEWIVPVEAISSSGKLSRKVEPAKYDCISMMDGCIEIQVTEEEVEIRRIHSETCTLVSKKMVNRYRILQTKVQHGVNGEPDDVDVEEVSSHDSVEDALLEAMKIVIGWEIQNDYEGAFWQKQALLEKAWEVAGL